MAEFTFLELHLDDATITNNAPYSGADPSADDDGADGEGSRSLLGLLVLGVLVGVAALAAQKLRAGTDEDESLPF